MTGDGMDGARVVRARVFDRDAPLRRPLRGANGPVTVRRVRILELAFDDDVVGLGDASAVDWLRDAAGDDVDRQTAELLERVRADAPPAAALLHWSANAPRAASLRAAVQTALVDADARRCGLPLATRLGGRAAPSALPLSALVVDDDPAEMAAHARALAATGLASFKVKVGRPRLDDDVARVFAVREAIGPGAELRLDANGAWSASVARDALRALAACAPSFVEEPVADAAEVAGLGAPVPLALDESVRDASGLDAALARGGFAVLVLKLERTGGPLAALALAARAAAAGVDVVWTDSLDGEVGRAATLHAAAAHAARSGREPLPVGLGGLFVLDGEEPRAVATLADEAGLGLDAATVLRGATEVFAGGRA